jgi:predicted Fe-Mo cluster-binding NifX family protein
VTINESENCVKIAVASTDGVSISPHFGRSRSFIVFDVAEGKIARREIRDNTHTAFVQGKCQEGAGHHHHAQPHSHADIVNALSDCQVVLCYGMGWRAAEDLKRAGIQPFVLDAEASAEEAVRAFLDGKVKPGGAFCRCHEH